MSRLLPAGEPRWRTALLLLPRAVGAVVAAALLGLIRGYQVLVSPYLGPSCRFHPSCSAYAAGSLRTHGALKGTALAAWRLLRCNPWNLGGLDPVPARGAWRPDILPDGRPRSRPEPPRPATVPATVPATAPASAPARPVPSMRVES